MTICGKTTLVQTLRSGRLRPGRRAFSLPELMIATGILGIGMILVAMAFPVALDQSRQATELATSKLVYYDAVNKLKTRIKWTELEAYINPDDADANDGAYEGVYRLGPDEVIVPPVTVPPEKRIYLLSFDNVLIDPGGAAGPDFFSSAAMSNINCVYDADDTYGWVAAVQKISEKTYKFWIFVIREPTGMTVTDGAVEKLKFQLISNQLTTSPTAAAPKRLDFSPLTSPSRGTDFLAENGMLYRVMETLPGSNIVMCNREVYDGTAGIGYTAYVDRNSNIAASVQVQITRRNPVLTVYQTVISY